MIFLGVVVLLPFHLGRFIVHQLSYMLSSATSPMFSTVLPITEQALSLVNITLKNTLTIVTNSTYEKNPNVNDTTLASVNIFKGDSRLSDASTLAVGYISIFTLIIFYLGVRVSGAPSVTPLGDSIHLLGEHCQHLGELERE
ncbi:hypothetical protein Hanom_Chr12g01151341 [Helianthus anomalus]